ncbi:hypothetical protein M1466_03515 [Candidatus Dependentiae bacterium]|nr:hypothetical protein [Candidatus Dependentiae bacterium]
MHRIIGIVLLSGIINIATIQAMNEPATATLLDTQTTHQAAASITQQDLLRLVRSFNQRPYYSRTTEAAAPRINNSITVRSCGELVSGWIDPLRHHRLMAITTVSAVALYAIHRYRILQKTTRDIMRQEVGSLQQETVKNYYEK